MRGRYPRFPSLPAETMLDKILYINVHNRGVIKVIFNILSTLHSPSLLTIRSHWENDCALEIMDTIWQSVLQRVHSSSICARHGLLQFKVLHRLHLAKEKLAKIYPGVDPSCNRCKIVTGSLIHTFWTLDIYIWYIFWGLWSQFNPFPFNCNFWSSSEDIGLPRHTQMLLLSPP